MAPKDRATAEASPKGTNGELADLEGCGGTGRSRLARNRGQSILPRFGGAFFLGLSANKKPRLGGRMGAAFDAACQSFPPDLKDHEGLRRKLALLILRHMDRGERDATRLSDLALLDFMR
jgi:hypothetical protein